MVDITLVEGEPSVNEKGKESCAKMSTSFDKGKRNEDDKEQGALTTLIRTTKMKHRIGGNR